MTRASFDALVQRLECRARRHPAAYRLQVLLLALLGNAYLWGVLMLLAAAVLFVPLPVDGPIVFLVRCLAATALVAWLAGRVLHVQMPVAQGIELRPGEAPALAALIEALRVRMGAPRIDRVLIGEGFNASLVQHRQRGPLAPATNELLLGLPLLTGLSVPQLEAVLAHELAHLARGHGRLSGWVHRLRARWLRLADALDSVDRAGAFLFAPFLHWYGPYFNACAFPLARAIEYEADAASARSTSPEIVAEALTGVSVLELFLNERYWADLFRRADDCEHPGFTPYAALAAGIAAGLEGGAAPALLARAMAQATATDETHPALADRLAALGQPPRLALPARGMAADGLLGAAREPITRRFDDRWQERAAPHWERRHREVRAGRRRLAALDAAAERGPLAARHAIERAGLTETFGAGAEAALDQFRAAHAREPALAITCFALGARLLARDDPSGEPLLEAAIALDDEALLPGAQMLRDFCLRNGAQARAGQWDTRYRERRLFLQQAQDERSAMGPRDAFAAHGLDGATVQALCNRLRRVDGLRHAWLARKQMRDPSHGSCFVLGFSVTAPWRLHDPRRAARAQREIVGHVALPPQTFVINLDAGHRRYARRLQRQAGARLI
ncbi:MAG: M48 family metallopeptidase [Gammaproteobacteria bacterium]